jgi:hypothetical protein
MNMMAKTRVYTQKAQVLRIDHSSKVPNVVGRRPAMIKSFKTVMAMQSYNQYLNKGKKERSTILPLLSELTAIQVRRQVKS